MNWGKKKKELTIEKYSKMLRKVFSTGDGEKVLEVLKEDFSERSSFSENPYETAFKEGQRSVILDIIQDMETN